MADTTKRNISLPVDLDARLTDVSNVSGLIAELLTRELDRQDRASEEAASGVVTIEGEEKTFKFRGRYLDQDDQDSYYLHENGTLVMHGYGEDPHVYQADEIETLFNSEETNLNIPEGVCEAFDIKPVVWL